MSTYEEHCGSFDDYSLKYVKYLVRECEALPEIHSLIPTFDRIKAMCQWEWVFISLIDSNFN